MSAAIEKIEKQFDRELIAIFKGVKNAGSSGNIRQTFATLFANKMVVVTIIHSGLPYSFFDLVKQYAPFTEGDWTGFLELSSKSLQRYRDASKKFAPLQSERILEITEVTKLGLEVFEDMEKFRLWLDTPSLALGRHRPKDLLKDSYGKGLVVGELTRINYGIFA